MSFVYITEDGAALSISGGCFNITHRDGQIEKIPKETLESVALFGNVSVTTPCIKEFLTRNIPVSYFSKHGAYFGKLESTCQNNIKRLKKQIYASDDENFCLALSKKIIEAKISNQLVIARRYIRNKSDEEFEEIDNIKYYKKKIKSTHNIEELMGYEGAAAKLYFSLLAKLVDKDFAFSGRSKRPPLDPFNSMLSLGYTILMYEIYGEINNKGLA